MTAQSRRGRPSNKAAAALTEKLVDVAFRLFLEQGYAGTSLDAIAAQASVGKHTLYRRFPNKSALFAAVMVRGADGIEAVAASQPGTSALEKLRALAAASLATLARPQVIQVMRMVIAEGPRFPELAELFNQSGGAKVIAAAETLVLKAQAEGDLGAGDPAWLARMCLAMTSGMPFQRSLTGPNEYQAAEARAEHFDAAWRLFLEGARGSKVTHSAPDDDAGDA
jgi:AcrR family transcriptional regulator